MLATFLFLKKNGAYPNFLSLAVTPSTLVKSNGKRPKASAQPLSLATGFKQTLLAQGGEESPC